MDKRSYFLAAMNGGAAEYKHWVLSTFTVLHPSSHDKMDNAEIPFRIIRNPQDAEHVYFMNAAGVPDIIDEATWDEPIFRFSDRITLEPKDIANVTEKVETRIGNVLYNQMVLVYAFGDKMSFRTGKIKGSKLEVEIAAKLKDTPEDDTKPRKATDFYVDELLRYGDATSALAGFTGIDCPAASEKTMTVDPTVIKRRDELLQQNKDKLDDPAVIASMEKELTELDRKTFGDDPALSFYVKSKTFDISRKRCFIMFGAESGFETNKPPKLIVPSLKEGWDLNNLPGMVESLRAGSYNRGHETALGGESVKYFYRIFQNTRVLEPDCGTKRGLTWPVLADTIKRFVGLYPMEGKRESGYTEEELKPLVGKDITVRTPLYCLTKAPSFCAKCVGDAFAMNPTGLHIAVSDVGSRFLYVFMQAMHGKALRTAEYRIDSVFS